MINAMNFQVTSLWASNWRRHFAFIENGYKICAVLWFAIFASILVNISNFFLILSVCFHIIAMFTVIWCLSHFVCRQCYEYKVKQVPNMLCDYCTLFMKTMLSIFSPILILWIRGEMCQFWALIYSKSMVYTCM